jgi:protein-S-isoprenylcysteine O-methyltransferase Ste14
MYPMRICSMLWLFVLIVWVVFGLRRKQTQQRETVGSRLKYSIPTVLGFYLLFASGIDIDWLNRNLIPGVPSIQWLGIALTAIGVAFAIWARVYIGENWSGIVTVKVGHELVRTGPYAWVRHPIYSGLLLATLGTALVRGEVRGLVALAVLWFGFWIKSRVEEQFMLKTFGPAYAEYSQTTGALIPRLH